MSAVSRDETLIIVNIRAEDQNESTFKDWRKKVLELLNY